MQPFFKSSHSSWKAALGSVLVSHQEYVGTVPADNPDAHGLMLRLSRLPADVNWTQVDDAFAEKKKVENLIVWK